MLKSRCLASERRWSRRGVAYAAASEGIEANGFAVIKKHFIVIPQVGPNEAA